MRTMPSLMICLQNQKATVSALASLLLGLGLGLLLRYVWGGGDPPRKPFHENLDLPLHAPCSSQVDHRHWIHGLERRWKESRTCSSILWSAQRDHRDQELSSSMLSYQTTRNFCPSTKLKIQMRRPHTFLSPSQCETWPSTFLLTISSQHLSDGFALR